MEALFIVLFVMNVALGAANVYLWHLWGKWPSLIGVFAGTIGAAFAVVGMMT